MGLARGNARMDEHLTVQRLEDMRFLLEAGTPLEDALARVGWNREAYEKAAQRTEERRSREIKEAV